MTQACISSRDWSEQQYLLEKQTIEGNQNIPDDKFTVLYRQKPNRSIFWMKPYLWFHQVGRKMFKPERVQSKLTKVENLFTLKIREAENRNSTQTSERLNRRKNRKTERIRHKLEDGNFLMRTVGEKPTFYDSLAIQETANQMRQLLHSKGFFQGDVAVIRERKKNQRIEIVYQIDENQPTFIGKVNHYSSSRQIERLIDQNKSDAKLIEKQNYDTEKIEAERSRIEKLLRNNGYFDFKKQYIKFDIDTLSFQPDTLHKDLELKDDSLVNLIDTTTYAPRRTAKIDVIINDPLKGTHQAYNFGNIYFHLVSNRRKQVQADTITSEETGIRYIFSTKKINYGYKILDRRIKIKSGQLYKDEDFFATQNSLGNLDMFKFVSMRPDTTQQRLNINIFATPLERYQLSDEIGFNTSLSSLLPGPFLSITLKNRNTFGGFEVFENSFRFSIIGQAGFSTESQLYGSQEFTYTSSLIFPQVLFPRKLIYRRLRQNIENYNPTTRLNLGINFTRRPEYTRGNLVASISYQGQLRNASYNLTLAELSIVNTLSKSTAFNQQLLALQAQGNPIINSFDRALVSSIYFIYTYNNSTDNPNKKSYYFRFLVEAGGTTLNFLREISINNNDRIFGLKFFQYWRINPTFHYYLPLNQKSQQLAFRLNAGLAKPYGTVNTLPYEKFFFGGGSTSLRAWRPRRIGPGSYTPPVNDDGTFNYDFEQPGEIILEGNVEYRFPVNDLMRMALFIDVGNVWTLQNDESRPGGQFKFNSFWKEIAIGTGFGFRFNLPFLLLRLDIGIKTYDPARTPDRRWVIEQFFARPTRLMLLNLGLGYPF